MYSVSTPNPIRSVVTRIRHITSVSPTSQGTVCQPLLLLCCQDGQVKITVNPVVRQDFMPALSSDAKLYTSGHADLNHGFAPLHLSRPTVPGPQQYFSPPSTMQSDRQAAALDILRLVVLYHNKLRTGHNGFLCISRPM